VAAGPFKVQIEVKDACGVWKMLAGGGPSVP
jgi:hypothetical protein